MSNIRCLTLPSSFYSKEVIINPEKGSSHYQQTKSKRKYDSNSNCIFNSMAYLHVLYPLCVEKLNIYVATRIPEYHIVTQNCEFLFTDLQFYKGISWSVCVIHPFKLNCSAITVCQYLAYNYCHSLLPIRVTMFCSSAFDEVKNKHFAPSVNHLRIIQSYFS